MLALEQLGGVTGVFHVLDAALQFASGVAEYLAVLGGDHCAYFVGMLLQQHLQIAHDPGALQRRRIAPGREGRLRRCNGLLYRDFVGQQQALFGAPGGRVVHRL